MSIQRFVNTIPAAAVVLLAWYGWASFRPPSSAQQPMQFSSKTLPDSQTWQVVRVSDGDTVRLRSPDREISVRLCGVDAPEIKHGAKPEQPLGRKSLDRLQELIDQGDGSVVLIPVETDRYGRVVGELLVIPLKPAQPNEEIFLNSQLVEEGLAYHYSQYSANCPNQRAIIEAEAIAKQNRAGVWSLPDGGERPWEYRKRYR